LRRTAIGDFKVLDAITLEHFLAPFQVTEE